jgi:phospholipid transport system transporter-binding protein
MMQDRGDRIEVGGAMTLPAATALLGEGAAFLGRGDAVFDLGGVTEVDSSGLAVIFGWQREAKRLNRDIRIVNPPPSLKSLADVYGVSELLPF